MRALIVKTLIVVMASTLLMASGDPAKAQALMYEGSLDSKFVYEYQTIILLDPKGNAVIPPIKTDRSGNFTFSISEGKLKKHQKDGIVISVKDPAGNEVHRERVGIIVVDGTLGIEPGDDFRPKRFR